MDIIMFIISLISVVEETLMLIISTISLFLEKKKK